MSYGLFSPKAVVSDHNALLVVCRCRCDQLELSVDSPTKESGVQLWNRSATFTYQVYVSTFVANAFAQQGILVTEAMPCRLWGIALTQCSQGSCHLWLTLGKGPHRCCDHERQPVTCVTIHS